MEQKTEASQAVDEPVLPHLPRAVGYLHTMDNTEGLKGNQPWRIFNFIKRNPFGKAGLDYSASYPVTNESLFTASQMKEYARAALKAQPAPTEAFGEPFDPKDEKIKRLQGLIAAYEQIIAAHEARDKRAIKYANSAQIAPTEAAESSMQKVHIPFALTKAQGEDSARLDFFAPLVLNPLCGCAKCNPSAVGRMMILCAICGNKRCPHAADHGFFCTSSNEPGQVGVPYEIDRARASAETGGVKS